MVSWTEGSQYYKARRIHWPKKGNILGSKCDNETLYAGPTPLMMGFRAYIQFTDDLMFD